MSTPSIKVGQGNWGIKTGNLLGYANTEKKFSPVEFTSSRALNTATRVNASGNIQAVNADIPRIDYFGGQASLLVEPSAQNLALRSDEFRTIAEGGPSNSWTANDTVIISVNNLSPDGTNNATRIRGATTPTNRARQQVITGTSGVAYVGSAWIRRVSGTSPITLRVGDAGSTTNISPTSTWQRFSFSSTPTTTTVRIAFVFPNDTDEFEIWGAQLEVGSIATSYIPTTTGTVTRNADVVSVTGIAGLIGQTEGTIYAEVDIRNMAKETYLIRIDDGATANAITLRTLTSNLIRTAITAPTTSGTINISSAAFTVGIVKIAFAYKSGEIALSVNGATALTANGTFVFGASLNRITLGSNVSASSELNDRIRAVSIYQTRLPNTTTDGSPSLQSITTL